MSNVVRGLSQEVAEPLNTKRWTPALMYVGVGAGIGAVFGALTNPRCEGEHAPLFCGPGNGAYFGAVSGLVITGLVGLGIAAFSEKHRDMGVKVAAVGIGVPLTLGIAGRLFGVVAT